MKANYITKKEAAEIIKVSLATLDNYIRGGYYDSKEKRFIVTDYGFPAGITKKVGRLVRIKEAPFLRWAESKDFLFTT